VTDPGPLLSGAGLRALLTNLDHQLHSDTGEQHPLIELAVVGGAAMALQWQLRSTRDLDFITDNIPPQLLRAARQVAARHELPDDWLNDRAKGFVPQIPYDGVEVFRGDTIVVTVPSNRYLLAMKLYSARETDLDDAAFLTNQSGLSDIDSLLDLVTTAYAGRPVQAKVQYFATEVTARATHARQHPRQPIRHSVEDLDRLQVTGHHQSPISCRIIKGLRPQEI
jgi:hypothetical protein